MRLTDPEGRTYTAKQPHWVRSKIHRVLRVLDASLAADAGYRTRVGPLSLAIKQIRLK